MHNQLGAALAILHAMHASLGAKLATLDSYIDRLAPDPSPATPEYRKARHEHAENPNEQKDTAFSEGSRRPRTHTHISSYDLFSYAS